MTDLPIQNGMIPDPLAGKREQAPRGVIGIIERYHQLRFWMILGFIGMSWFLLAMERMRVMTPAQLAHTIVDLLALYGYIAFLFAMMVTIVMILWIEWKGWRELHTIDDERLDAVEIAHPYLPRKHHLVAALVLALTFPLFVWQAQAQIVALTYSEAGPEPAHTLYTEQRSWQIANDGDGTPNTRTWDNGGGDGLWSTAANWSGDTVPDSDDTAYFGTTSTADATVNTSFAGMLKDLKVAPGYTGVITLARNLTLSGGSVIQSGGTLNFGTYGRTLKVGSGFITYPQATLTAGTGTIFLAGTGTTQQLTSTGSFYNLTINNGLVAYWKLDEGSGSSVAKDSTGNGYNGTLTSGPTWSDNRSSTVKFNNPKSLHFDGTNDWVSVTSVDALNPKSITISAWIYPEQAGTGGNQGIVSKSANATNGWLFYRSGAAPNEMLVMGVFTTSLRQATTTVGTLGTLHQWYHVAGTYDADAGRVYAFVNGTRSTVTTASGPIATSSTNLAIGNLYTTGQHFRGFIDDVRVYNRALSQSEVVRLSNGYQDTGSGVYQLGSSLDVNGSLAIVSGGINASSNNLNVAGNWANYGTFAKGTSTVALDGSSHQTMSGWTVFNNLTATTSTARTLFLGYAGHQSVSGSLVLRGVSGNKLSIRSTRSASGARLDWDADVIQGGSDIRHLDVKDANAGSGQTLICGSNEGCTDSGNNTNWSFAAVWETIAGTVYSDEGTTSIAAGKRINVSLNGGAHVGSGVTIAGGYYRATLTGATLTGGTIISIYIDDDSADAVTVTLGSGSSMTGMHLYQDRLIVRSDSGSVALTNAHLNVADNSADADITSIYRVNASNVLQVSPDKELFIWSGDTYTPGAAVKTHDLDVRGTLTLSTNYLTVSGSLVASAGTLTTSTGILLNARASNETLTFGSNSAQNLRIDPVSNESNMKLWWKFDEGSGTSAADSSGNGNTGTISSGTWTAAFLPPVQFTDPYSVKFDGTSVTSSANINAIYTIAAWIRPTAFSTYHTILSQGGNYLLMDVNVNSDFSLWTSEGISNNSIGINDLSTDTWYHIALVREGNSLSQGYKSYLNGEFKGSLATTTWSPNDTITVGYRAGVGQDFKGYIDDVRIYNRALTPTQINRLGRGFYAGSDSDAEYTLGSSLDVNGNLYLANGNLVADSNTVTVGGNWANYTGTGFVKGTSTVSFDGSGAQTLSGTTAFNILSVITSTARTIFFDHYGRQSASGSLVLNGAAANLLSLRSTKSASGAKVDLDINATQATADIKYLNVKDIRSGSGQALNCFSSNEGCVNSGNNPNWNFAPAYDVTGTVYSDEGTTPLTGVTVSASVNGKAASGSDVVDSGGQFTITSVPMTGGTILSLYIDGSSSHKAVTVTLGSGGVMTGMHLYKDHLIARSDSGSVALTNAHLNIADNNGDSDIKAIFNVDSSSTLQVAADKELWVWTGDTYTPGARVKTHDLEVKGTLTLSTNGLTVTGSLITGTGTLTTSTGITLGSVSSATETLTLGSNTAQNLTINNGLFGYWKLDEGQGTSVRDATGSNRDGTITGATWSRTVPSTKFHNPWSLSFDGNDYVTLQNTTTFNPAYITVSAWARNANWAGTVNQMLVAKGVNEEWILWKSDDVSNDEKVSFRVGGLAQAYGTTTLQNDTWYHITGTYDGARIRVYLNGVQEGSFAYTSGIPTGTDPILIGAGNVPASFYSTATIDDVRVYSRALSTSEISRLASGYADTGSGTYTLGSSLDVNGNLSIASSILSAGSYNINLAGNLLNAAGFTKGTSTVTLDGTGNQTVSGSTIFHALSATTSAARTIFFDYSGRQSASGSLTLRGVSGNKLSLRSTRAGSGAQVDLDADVSQLSTDFAQADVKDIHSGSGQTLTCYINAEGCTNSGNNTNWTFTDLKDITGTVYADTGATIPLTGVTVALSVNGAAAFGTDAVDSGGQFTIANVSTLTGGSILTLYIDGSTHDAVTVSTGSGGAMTGITLIKNNLIVRSGTGTHTSIGSPVTSTTLNVANNNADSDISAIYTMSSLNTTVAAGKTMYVWTGSTFNLGGTLAVGGAKTNARLHINGNFIQNNNALTLHASYTQSGGTFTGSTGGSTIELNGSFAMDGGTFIGTSGTMDIDDNFTTTNSAVFTHNSGTVEFGDDCGDSDSTINTSVSFYNVTFAKTCTMDLIVTGTMDINGSLTVSNNSTSPVTGGTVTVAGDTVINAMHTASSDITFKLDGSNQLLEASSYGPGNIEIASSGTVTLSGTIIVRDDWTYTSGTVNAGVSTVQISLIGCTGTPSILSATGMTFYNLSFVKNCFQDTTLSGPVDVNGSLVVNMDDGDGVALLGGLIRVAQNIQIVENDSTTTTAITLDGTGSQIIELEAATAPGGRWTIAKPSGTATLSGALTLNTSGQDLFMTGGTLDLNGNNLTVNDRFDVGTGTTLRLNGDETISGGPDRVQRGATLYYDDPGGSTQLLNVPYYHLILGSTGSTTFRYPHRTQLNLTGSLTISGGTLTVTNGQRLNVSGSLIQYKGGAFSAGTGTVNLRTVGPATLSGSSAFNHLNISNGLLLNWKFETGSGKGVVPDSSGNSKIGQRMGSGSVFSTSVPTTKYNNLRSMSFNGASDYVEVPEVFDGNGDFTAGLWFKAETGLRQHTFVGQYENVAGGNNVNGFWFMKMGNGQVSANIRGTDLTPIGGFVLNADGQYHDGAWHYAAMSRRGSTLWLYVDNTAKSTSTTAVDISTTGTPMRLSVKGMTQKYAGLMDDVRIYNRALSASEIRQLAAGYQDTGSGMYTLGSSLDVNGNLSIVGGGINAGSKSLNVAGNLANYGTFTKGTSTVTLDGSSHQTISGSTVFNTLSATTSTARTIFFDYTGRQSASGSLILRGVSGNKLSLRSTRSGSGARVDLDADASQISTDFAYNDVKDINSGSGQTITCTVFEGCTDRGNNTNWTFGNFNSISGTAYSDEGTTGISAGRVVSISLNGGAVTGSGFTRAGGFYTATLTGATLTGGTIVTAYLDEATEDAVTITLGTADSMTGMHLYQDRLIVRSDSGSVVLTNNHLNVANNNADADIAAIYTMDSSDVLQVAADKELFVWSGDTYTPGAAVKTHDLDVRGTLTLASNDLTVSGSLVASAGTFTTSADIILNARSSNETFTPGSNSLQNLIVDTVVSDTGLVGWWKFDEGSGVTTEDSSDSNNDGTLTDGPTWSTAERAPLYAANPASIYIDANSAQYVSIGSHSEYTFGETNPFTASAWMRMNQVTGSDMHLFGSVKVTNLGFGFTNVEPHWRMGVDANGALFGARRNESSAYAGSTPAVGEWHHAVLRYDGSDITMFLDGVAGPATPSGDISSDQSNSTLRLGCSQPLSNFIWDCFDGYMDDMRIYDRALSDVEISRLAAGALSATSSTSNYTLGSSIDINGDVALLNGTITAGSNNLTVAGNWLNTTGTGFVKGTSTVVLDGSGNQTLSGSTNFYGLSATTSAARTIFFDYRGRQSAEGSLTLRGVVGNLLSLRSTKTDDAAEIDLDADATQLSTDFAYLNIKDMNAENGQMLICYTSYEGCIDNGNNTNWDFFPTAGTGTVKGLVWRDQDGDGVKDVDEIIGLNEDNSIVSVSLVGTTATGGTVNRTTATNNAGQFFFSGALVSNSAGYTVAVNSGTAPSGYIRTRFNSSGSNLVGTGTVIDLQFGYALPSTIEGSRFVDTDKDGVHDGSENTGVTVPIALSGTSATGGTVSASAFLFSANRYIIAGIPPGGPYTVTVNGGTAPSGYVVTRGTSTGITIATDAELLTNVDFGFYWYATMTGAVFIDTDGDGNKDISETDTYSGATISLSGMTSTGASINLTTLTTSTGAFAFPLLPMSSGNYAVSMTAPANYAVTTSLSVNRSVTAGSVPASVSFGLLYQSGTGTVKGLVWNDEDGDGLKDAEETTGISGVSVALNGTTATGGTINWNTTTASTGQFFFSGALVSNTTGYTVTVNGNAAPTGYIRTRFNSSGSNLVGTGTVTDVQFGYVLPSTISGSVFVDSDEDGLHDGSETTVFNGVTLALTGTTSTGGSISLTTQTDSTGEYAFTGLPPVTGNYLLIITPPDDYDSTSTDSRSVAIGTGGQLKIQQFGYIQVAPPASSSSSSAASSTTSTDGEGGGTRGTTIVVQPTPVTGGTSSAPSSDSEEGEIDNQPAEEVRDLINNIDQRREERLKKLEETRDERVEETKDIVTDWVIGQVRVPIVPEVVNALSDAWRLALEIGQVSGEAMKDSTIAIGLGLNTVAEKAAFAVSDTTAAIEDQAVRTIELARAQGEAIIQVALSAGETVVSGVSEVTTVIASVVNTSIETAFNAADETLRQFGAAGEMVANALDGARIAAGEAIDTMQIAAADLVTLTGMGLQDLGETTATGVSEIAAVFGEAADVVTTDVGEAIALALVAVEDSAELTQQTIADTVELATIVATESIETVAVVAEEVNSVVTDVTTDVQVAMTETVESITQSASETIVSAGDSVREFGRRTGENARIAFEQMRRGVTVQEIAELPPQKQYETEIRKDEEGQILVAQLTMSIFDSLGLPVTNTPVVLFSTPKVSITNDEGVATFHDVEVGEHHIEVHINNGEEVLSQEIIIEPPANIDLDELEEVDAVLPVIQVVAAGSTMHGAAPYQLAWLWAIVGALTSSNIIWIVLWLRKRRDVA